MIQTPLLSALVPLLLTKSAAPALAPGLPLGYPAELQARLTEARRFTGVHRQLRPEESAACPPAALR